MGRKAGLPEEVKSVKPVDEENAELVFVEVEDAAVVCTGVISDLELICSNIWNNQAWHMFKKNESSLQSRYHPFIAAYQMCDPYQIPWPPCLALNLNRDQRRVVLSVELLSTPGFKTS